MMSFKKFSGIVIFSLLSLSFSVADALFNTFETTDIIEKPHRIVEFGLDANVAVANTSVGVSDVLQKEITIDLKKIANELPDDGFSIGFYNREKFFLNLNFTSRFRFGFFAGVESTGRFTISKDLFDLLASGLSIGETTVDVKGAADIFADAGVSVQTIVSGWAIKITPTYFIPIVYVPKTSATGSLITNVDGSITAHAEANVNIYTAVNMQSFMEDEKSYDSLNLDYGDLLSNGGLDLTLELERNWLHNFNAGLYTRIPLKSGSLNYKMSTKAWVDFETENLLDDLINDNLTKPEPQKEDFTYSEDTYKVYRPLKFGLNASWSPFGQWFKVQPALGFAIRDPFSGNSAFYMEYALDLRFAFLLRIFNFDIGTSYQNQIFQQRFGFSLNLRAFEIIAQASFAGTSFFASFDRNGYGAFIGFRMGF